MFGFQPIPLSNNKCMETPTWTDDNINIYLNSTGLCNPLHTSQYVDLLGYINYNGDARTLCFDTGSPSMLASGHYIYIDGSNNNYISCEYNVPLDYQYSVRECDCPDSNNVTVNVYSTCPNIIWTTNDPVDIYVSVDEYFTVDAEYYVVCGNFCQTTWVHDGSAMAYANDPGGYGQVIINGIPNAGDYEITSYAINGCLDPEAAYSGTITFHIHVS